MSMSHAILQFVISAAVIVAAGTVLTRTADTISELTRLGRLLIGGILLAGATSLPELIVDLHAVRIGMPDLAVGDLVGSSLFNLLILAIGDLCHHSRGRMFSRTAASHALAGTASIVLAAVVAILILATSLQPEASFGEVGSLLIVIVYASIVRLVFYDQQSSARPMENAEPANPGSGRTRWIRVTAAFVGSAGTIIVAGPFLAQSAGALAELSGLGGTFVGSTLVAFCTSLPELVATITAVRMGAVELAIGNIYGSNAFNMVLLWPLDLAQNGPLLAAVSATHAITCLCTVVITAVAVIGQLYHVENRTRLVEPDAFLVILLVLGSLGLIYQLR